MAHPLHYGKAQSLADHPLTGEREFFGMPPLPITASVAGKIVNELGTAVPSVTLNLTGSSSGMAVTSASGQYYFTLDPEGDYAVTPSKSNDVMVTNGISTIDLLLVRQHVLATIPFTSPYKIIAADVDGSGAVGTLDFLLIRTVVLQINTTFPNGRLWTFVSSDFAFADPRIPFPYQDTRTYTNIMQDLQNQDFVGIKLGDVNNSWDPATPKLSANGNVQMAIGNYSAYPESEIVIPVRVKDFRNITGYQFTLSWNPEVLRFIGVSNKALNGYFGLNRTAEGLLTTSWYDELVQPVTLSDSETVFELNFLAAGNDGASSEIRMDSKLAASEAYNGNLDMLEITARNGMVKVNGGFPSIANHQSSAFNLQVFPNPFKEAASISFAVPEDQVADILIYNIEGKLVKESKGFYSAGHHQILWDGRNSSGECLSAGCYYIKVNAGSSTGVAKVMRVK